MGVTGLVLLRQSVDVAEAALEDATDAHVGTDAQKQTYLRLEAETGKLDKVALPDPRAAPS